MRLNANHHRNFVTVTRQRSCLIAATYYVAFVSVSLTLLFSQIRFIELTEAADTVKHVTCGSVIKLENDSKPKVRLHSHDIKYGSGSGQQSVTAQENQDTNSYW